MIKASLSDLANITMGTSPAGEFCGAEIIGMPLLNGPAEFTDFYPVPAQFTSAPKRLSKPDDILFCVRGSTTGRMNWSDQEYAIGRGLAAISHKSGSEYNHFLRYLLENNLNSLLNNTNGSTFPNLTSDILAGFIFTIPDLGDQKKISAVLKSVDTKIAINNRINNELEAMAKTLYNYWFVQFDFPGANGKPYKNSGGKMVYNPALKREIPEGWSDGALDDLGQIVGGSTPSTQNSENFTSTGTPWITPYDLSSNRGNKFISRGAQDVSAEGIKLASLKKHPAGTVLLSSRAPIGYMAIARNEVTTNQGFKSFIVNKGYSTEFIYYTVSGSLKTITQYASGSTFKEISTATLKTVKVVLPKSKIIETYTTSVQPMFFKQDLLEKENEQLIQLRDWLLPMLMNGQVTVK